MWCWVTDTTARLRCDALRPAWRIWAAPVPQLRGARVRQWNSAPRTMPSSKPKLAEKITSQTSETEEEPNTQLILTWPVLAITRAAKTTSRATATPADR